VLDGIWTDGLLIEIPNFNTTLRLSRQRKHQNRFCEPIKFRELREFANRLQGRTVGMGAA
jgi:hypothetical protein